MLIGSLSHLAETGLAAYAADLCTAVAKITASFNGSVSVAPAPFSLAEDTDDTHLIRSIHEFYGWVNACLKHVEGLSLSALNTSMEGLIYNGGGVVQPEVVCKYRLPTSFSDSGSQIWTSRGLASLPSSVKGFDMTIEAEIMGRLIADLNSCLGLDLQTNPYYDRTVVKEDLDRDNTVFILIGGSHALRTANGLARLGKRAIAATYGGWRPTPDQVTAIINKIGRARNLCPDPSKVVCVLQLWDNCNFFVQDEDGGLSTAKKEDDGYHRKGANVFAHADTQLMTFKKTLPVVEAVKDHRKIFLSPLPRYWQAGCCTNTGHVTNLRDPDYKQKLESSIYEAKNNLRAFSFREGIKNLRVVGSWHAVKKTTGIWGADPEHMKDAGYDVLASTIVSTAADMEAKRKGEPSLQSQPKKQRTATGEANRSLETRGRTNYQRNYSAGGDGGNRRADSRHDGSGRRFNDNYCSSSGSNNGSGLRPTSGSASGSGMRHMSGPSSGYGQRRRY